LMRLAGKARQTRQTRQATDSLAEGEAMPATRKNQGGQCRGNGAYRQTFNISVCAAIRALFTKKRKDIHINNLETDPFFLPVSTFFKSYANELCLLRTEFEMGVIRRDDSHSSEHFNSFQSGMVGLGFVLFFLLAMSFFITRDALKADAKLPTPKYPRRRWRRELVGVVLWLGNLILLVLALALTPVWIVLGIWKLFQYCNKDIDDEVDDVPAAGPADSTTTPANKDQAAEHTAATPKEPSAPPPIYQP
jgi:hypothetical protein